LRVPRGLRAAFVSGLRAERAELAERFLLRVPRVLRAAFVSGLRAERAELAEYSVGGFRGVLRATFDSRDSQSAMIGFAPEVHVMKKTMIGMVFALTAASWTPAAQQQLPDCPDLVRALQGMMTQDARLRD